MNFMMSKKILITGASGFVGSFLVEEALNQGFDVWAGMRASSSRKFLPDSRIRFAELEMSDKQVLASQLDQFKREFGGWDYIIHCAGVTKCIDRSEFMRVNYLNTRYFVEALQESGIIPERFVYISSLSVLGPIREQDYTDIVDTDIPQPNTAYGRSKVEAEKYLLALAPDFPVVILRPTGIYGPRERDYFMMAQSIMKHIDFAAGFKRQDITFVYVKDVVQAAFLALSAQQVIGKCYFLSDGEVYNSRAFSDLIQKELGVKWVLHFVSPIWLLKTLSFLAEMLSQITGKPSTLNLDKYRIMKQRNWRCDITPARKDLGYRPAYSLERGVREAMNWYKEAGWIKTKKA